MIKSQRTFRWGEVPGGSSGRRCRTTRPVPILNEALAVGRRWVERKWRTRRPVMPRRVATQVELARQSPPISRSVRRTHFRRLVARTLDGSGRRGDGPGSGSLTVHRSRGLTSAGSAKAMPRGKRPSVRRVRGALGKQRGRRQGSARAHSCCRCGGVLSSTVLPTGICKCDAAESRGGTPMQLLD